MTKKMLIDASHPEETRVVIVDGNRVEELDFESRNKRQIRGNVYLARVTRVEPSLQAAFVEYGGNRHGFLAFSEIHPDYYQIPHEDKLALLEAEAAENKAMLDTLLPKALWRKFKEAGVRAVQGSSGTIGKWPKWVKGAGGTVEAMNLSLCRLRNIGVEVAKEEGVRFADVYYPMLMGSDAARRQWGADFDLFGDDGVHPGWAGQGVMAYAFLKALGVDGEIGTLTVDFGKGKATASDGHRVVGFADGKLELESVRYPVCIEGGDVSRDDNLRATMAVVRLCAALAQPRLPYHVKGVESNDILYAGDVS